MVDVRQYNDRGYDPDVEFRMYERGLCENDWQRDKCNRFREINSHLLPEVCRKCRIICSDIGHPQKGICLPVNENGI